MTEVQLGILSSVFASIFILLLAFRYQTVAWPIIIGGAARMILAWLVYADIVWPPATQNDAMTFEQVAREWSALDWPEMMETDRGPSYFISLIGAVIYKAVGPSQIMLQIMIVCVGTLVIALTWSLARRLIGAERARIVTWIAALAPFTIIYSSVFLREMLGVAPFMFGLIAVVMWEKKGSTIWVILAFASFAIAALFHGAYAVAILVYGLLLLWRGFRKALSSSTFRKAVPTAFVSGGVGVLLLVALVTFALVSGTRLGSVGQLDERLTGVGDTIATRVESREGTGGSAYPNFLTGMNPFTAPWVIPGRIVYFVFSPFPWDIRAPSHMAGFTATFLYFYIALSLWKSRRYIFRRQDALTVLLIVAALVVVFGISIDNIGTSIRHRSKFMFALLALCYAPVFRSKVRRRRRVASLYGRRKGVALKGG